MKIASLLFVTYIGYVLGRSDLRVRPALTAVTVLTAATLHVLVQEALPHEELEEIATAAAWSWPLPLVAIVLLETAGIWIPVLVVHWTVLRTRIAASAFIMGAATLGALAYYQPFDAVIVNGSRIPNHPEYGPAFVLGLMLAAIPFAIGLRMKLRQKRFVATATLPTAINPQ
jgi:hypothetical protein